MNKVLRKIFIISILFFIGLSSGSVWAKTTIQYWHTWKANTWLPGELKKEFEKAYPQYELELLAIKGYNKVYDLYTLAHEQGNPPAILQATGSNTQAPRDSGWFKPLHEAIGGRTEINGLPVRLDEIVGPAAGFFSLDGKFHEMPFNASTPIIFANMDMLCLLYTSPSPRDATLSRMPSSA